MCLTGRCRSCRSHSDASAATHLPTWARRADCVPALLPIAELRFRWLRRESSLAMPAPASVLPMYLSCAAHMTYTTRVTRPNGAANMIFFLLPEKYFALKENRQETFASGCGTRHANKAGPRPTHIIYTHTHTQSRQKLSKFPKTFCSSLRFCRISVRDKAETKATTTETMGNIAEKVTQTRQTNALAIDLRFANKTMR